MDRHRADWDFPVAAASVEIRVPEGVPILNPQAYTVGRFRRAGDGIETAAAPGEFRATVTRALPPGPRLALDIGWPANAIAFAPAPLAPDARRAWQMSPALAAAAASLAGIAALFLVWLAVGRDRTRGTIYPQFDPPRSLSPAALRFVQRQGFDETCLTAAILSMAVKGRSGSRSTKAARNGACRSIRCRPWAPKASSSARASRRSTRRSWLGARPRPVARRDHRGLCLPCPGRAAARAGTRASRRGVSCQSRRADRRHRRRGGGGCHPDRVFRRRLAGVRRLGGAALLAWRIGRTASAWATAWPGWLAIGLTALQIALSAVAVAILLLLTFVLAALVPSLIDLLHDPALPGIAGRVRSMGWRPFCSAGSWRRRPVPVSACATGSRDFAST
ncbi:MAG: DUF2207 domain-containing protein [Rhodobacteraceae bacterium]|nr:DUF2207 domain-containing protein [Paracoccaceae bacterium]